MGLLRHLRAAVLAGKPRSKTLNWRGRWWNRLASDLQNAIPDTSTAVPGQSSALRRFGLFGTSSALQVDVLQVTPAQLLNADERRSVVAPSADKPARVPELHTVQYLFESPRDGTDPETAALPGLVRRNWTGKPPRPIGWTTASGRPRAAAADSGDPLAIAAPGLDPAEDTSLHVPEVVGLEFRYFDGSGWAGQWNSLTQRSLPAAVEVRLTLKPAESARAARRAATAPPEDEPPAPGTSPSRRSNGPPARRRRTGC